MNRIAVAMLLSFAVGCSSSDKKADEQDTSTGKDVAADGLTEDVSGDTADQPEIDTTPEEIREQVDDPGEDLVEPRPCLWKDIPQAAVDSETKKFALSMFHFNIQYVAGGLHRPGAEDGFELFCGEFCRGWTDERLKDWYIEVAFEPVLDLYMRYPHWQATFEMQGLMLEWMATRFPHTLEKLAAAAQRGQIEVVSLHYSDQFFQAFPRYDLAKSQEMTRKVFEDACVPLSPVVFNQEGQTGIGKHDFMEEKGYSIDVYPVNLYRFYHHGQAIPLFCKSGNIDVVVGPGEGYRSDKPLVFQKDEDTGVEVTWTFFDDGDLLTFPPSPYLAPLWNDDMVQEELDAYEAKLKGLEADGFQMSSVHRYVQHLKAHQVRQDPLPPVLDGTWQPIDTQSVFRWLGGRSIARYNQYERDNTMRIANYAIRTLLHAADILVARAGQEGHDVADIEASLQEGWRHMALAQVSDATGITPWPAEYEYGEMHNEEARGRAEAALNRARDLLEWPHARMDLTEGTAARQEFLLGQVPPPEVDAPLSVDVLAPTRWHRQTWFGHGPGLFEVHVAYGPGADPTAADVEQCRVTVRFPRLEERIRYAPSLLENAVSDHAITDFVYQAQEAWLPLPSGLIGLGDGWWVVKDCRSIHVAARIPHSQPFVEFIDETADPAGGVVWRFLVLQGTVDEALALAQTTNLGPVVYW